MNRKMIHQSEHKYLASNSWQEVTHLTTQEMHLTALQSTQSNQKVSTQNNFKPTSLLHHTYTYQSLMYSGMKKYYYLTKQVSNSSIWCVHS